MNTTQYNTLISCIKELNLETRTCKRDFKGSIGIFVYGFESFSQLEKLASDFDTQVIECYWKNGDDNTAIFRTHTSECLDVESLCNNDNHRYINSFNELMYEIECEKALLDDDGTNTSTLEALNDCLDIDFKKHQVILDTNGNSIEWVEKQPILFSYDNSTYAVGLLLPKEEDVTDNDTDE